MCNVLNRYRVSRGWHPLKAAEAEVQANVWMDELDRAGVPAEAYEALYRRAGEALSSALSRGEEPPDFTAHLLVGLWRGPNGLAAQLADRDEPRLIVCGSCGGSGWVRATVDGYPGVKKCGHRGPAENQDGKENTSNAY